MSNIFELENIFLTIVLTILFLIILYYFTPYSSYRLYLKNVPLTYVEQ